MPPNTTKVDRTSRWGNPFRVGLHGTQAECVALYQALASGALLPAPVPAEGIALARKQIADHIHELKGRNIACWCKPGSPCHGDVLLEIANR